MIENIVKIIINEYNGEIKQLLIPSDKKTNGTGLCNPSIFVEDDKIHLILSTLNIHYIILKMNKNIKQNGKVLYHITTVKIVET